MGRREDNESESEDSDFSDTDYELLARDTSHLKSFGISEETALRLWNKQSGLCYVSSLPMSFDGNNLYKAVVAPRRVNETVSDTNCILVCQVVNAMRESTDLTWTQFQAFINRISE